MNRMIAMNGMSDLKCEKGLKPIKINGMNVVNEMSNLKYVWKRFEIWSWNEN